MNRRTIISLSAIAASGLAAFLALAPLGVYAQQAAPTANKDVSFPRSMILDLAGEIEGMQGRQLRLRFVRFEPGGHTGIHSHKDRPEGVYVIQGELTNYQDGAGFSDVGVTRVRLALADVGEAPRHEVARGEGCRCSDRYGDWT